MKNACSILLFVALPALAQVSVTRTISPDLTPDGHFQVELAVAVEGAAPEAMIVVEELPDDWEIVAASWEDADCVPVRHDQGYRWLFDSFGTLPTSGTIRYELRVGDVTGPAPYHFAGTAKWLDGAVEVRHAAADVSDWEDQPLLLVKGWNLLCLPFHYPLASGDLAGVPVASGPLYGWDNREPAAGTYRTPENLMQAQEGFWVFARALFAGTVYGIGSPLSAPTPTPGWNLMGVAVEQAPADISEWAGCSTLWRWDVWAQRFAMQPSNELLERGRGYWVYCEE